MESVTTTPNQRPITAKVMMRDPWSNDVAAIVAMLPDAIFRCAPDAATDRMVWLLSEGQLAESLGIHTERIAGRTIQELMAPGPAEQMELALRAACRGVPQALVIDVDGRALQFAPQPVFDGNGACYAVIGFISDVTTLQTAEARVRELNALLEQRVHDLAAANQQLEAFASSVTHDLRSPLNAVSLAAQQLARRADVLDEAGRKALARLRNGVRRMSHLIDDVLRLARVAQQPIKREVIDVTALARQVAMERLALENSHGVEVCVATGLTARGDAALLRIALDNLISNAIKYTQGSEPARVEIGTASRCGRLAFFVRDNGMGFSMEDGARIFEPFERLEDAACFDGNGVGLATVKRVIDAHGGRVWAESAPGRGASFFFTVNEDSP